MAKAFRTPIASLTISNSLAVNSGASATVPITIKAAASQSANLQEWQDSAGSNFGYVTNIGDVIFASKLLGFRYGRFGTDTGYTDATTLRVTAFATDVPTAIFKAKSAQTANLQEWHNSSGSVLTAIDSAGKLGIGTASPAKKFEINNNGSSSPPLRISSSNDGVAIEFVPNSIRYNWIIGPQQNVSNAFEITPSSSVGGTTYSTPAIVILNDGKIGIGSNAPASALHVVGGALVTGNASVGGALNVSSGKVLGTYSIPTTDASATWIKLGTFTAAQTGQTIEIKISSHLGYNAAVTQNQTTYVYFKTSNGVSVQNGFAGDGYYWKVGQNSSAPSEIKIRSSASGVSASSFDVFGFFGTYNGVDGSSYQVQVSNGSTWTHSGTKDSDPGVASSSVLPLTYTGATITADIFTASSKIGVGTFSPASALHVVGGTVLGGAASVTGNITASVGTHTFGPTTFYDSNGINFTGSSSIEGGQINLLGGTSYTNKAMQLDNYAGDLRILYNNGGNVAVTVAQSTGNVGIGTSAPNTTLTVIGTASISSSLSASSILGTFVQSLYTGNVLTSPGSSYRGSQGGISFTKELTHTGGSGTVSNYWGVSILTPSISSTSGTLTITNAASFYVEDGPSLGTNLSVTNSWSIYAAGNVRAFSLYLPGTASIDGALTASIGTTTLGTTNSGNLTVTGTASITSNASVSGTFRAGNTTINGTASFTSSASATEFVTTSAWILASTSANVTASNSYDLSNLYYRLVGGRVEFKGYIVKTNITDNQIMFNFATGVGLRPSVTRSIAVGIDASPWTGRVIMGTGGSMTVRTTATAGVNLFMDNVSYYTATT